MLTDMPNAGYNTIGLACRLAFQMGLHQQSRWQRGDPYATHMSQRVFWTLYFIDRRISLACGRPYGIRDQDIDVDEPAWLCDKDVRPEQPLPAANLEESCNMYLWCMIRFAQFAGDIQDQVFSASTSAPAAEEAVGVLDGRIKFWGETVLPKIPLLPRQGAPSTRHLRQQLLVYTVSSSIARYMFLALTIS